MMDEYEQMLRDGLQQAARRRPQLEAVDLAEVMATPAADEDLVVEAASMPLKPPAWRRSGVRWAIGVSAAAVAASMFLVVPGFLAPKPVPAVPMTTPPPVTEPVEPAPTTDPTPDPTPDPEPGTDLAELTVSTDGWKTYSSPEYPVTFEYPADWEISHTRYTPLTAKEDQLTSAGIVDGCGISGCGTYVSPPGQNVEGGHAVVLTRNGFYGHSIGRPYSGAWLVATIPDLQVWTSADPTVPGSPAAIVTRSEEGFAVGGPAQDFGPPYELRLSTADMVEEIAMGDTNPVVERPEAAFTFGTNWGPEGDEAKIVATILASTRVNPDFDPTQPARDKSGRPKFWMASMDAPALDVDTSGWKTFDLPEGNISLRVPPKWKVSALPDEEDGTRSGIVYLEAPSGYIIDVLTNGEAEIGCQGTSQWEIPQRLADVADLQAPDAAGVTRKVELWWQDAIWTPAQVWLSLVPPSDGNVLCSQSAVDYGGEYPVYVGSADNVRNPTRAELDQATAILASVKRLH